ncbi:MAG: hypothetical protein O2856_19475 [Planctomycetota bacterium]|nr:hypothetical protein [Planctomycetota bacterium]
MTNLILDELHATRAKLLKEAGGDLHRYVEEARQRVLASARPIAEPTQRSIRSSGAAVDAGSESGSR